MFRIARPPACALVALLGTLVAIMPADAQRPTRRELFENFAPQPADSAAAVFALIGAISLIMAAYLIQRRIAAQQKSESRTVIQDAMDQIHGTQSMPNLLKPGDRVELEYVGEKTRRIYASRVQDVGESTVTLAAPRQEGAIVPLRVGDKIGIVVRDLPYSYRIETEILSRDRGGIPSLVVRRNPIVTRFQRRAFFRVKVALDCRFETFFGSVPPASLSRLGTITDLSGSGCRIQTPRPIGRARFLVLQFDLPNDGGTIRTTAEIVKKNTDRDAPLGGSIACHFIEISHVARERLVKYVMEAERKRIRKAKGLEPQPPRRPLSPSRPDAARRTR